MAAKYDKDIVLPVPVEMENHPMGFAMDIGGSITKLMYRTKEKLPPKDGMSQRIRIAYLNRDDQDNLAAFVRERCDMPEHNVPMPLTTTGVGGTQYAKVLNEKLNVTVSNSNEMDCFTKGFKFLLSKKLTDDEFFYPIPREAAEDASVIVKGFLPMMMMMEEEVKEGGFEKMIVPPKDMMDGLETDAIMETYGKGPAKFPIALAMCGSGCAVMIINDSGAPNYTVSGYTPHSGRHLLGLGRLLTGAKTYDELMSLALKGDWSAVNNVCGDFQAKGTQDMYTSMPAGGMNFMYGKAMNKDRDEFSKEDLAAAVVMNVFHSIVEFCHLQAQCAGAQTVYFCGAMFDHPFARRLLAYSYLCVSLMDQRPGKFVTFKMARLGVYIGCIGAWLVGMEKAAKEKEEKAAKEKEEKGKEEKVKRDEVDSGKAGDSEAAQTDKGVQGATKD